MKTIHLSIITIVGIVIITATVAGVFLEKLGENQPQPYTRIMINGMRGNYTVGESVSFSVTLEGYGSGCGDTKAAITKENDTHFQSLGWASEPSCVSDANLHNFKFNSISANTRINQTGNYVLTVSFNDSVTYRHTETVAEFSVFLPKLTSINDTGIASTSARVINTNFTVNYNISEGRISEIKLDGQSRALEILLNPTGNGTITIDLPRALIDAKGYQNMDDKFIVLEDGHEAEYEEIHKTMADRTLSIPFQQGVGKIVIIGVNPI